MDNAFRYLERYADETEREYPYRAEVRARFKSSVTSFCRMVFAGTFLAKV